MKGQSISSMGVGTHDASSGYYGSRSRNPPSTTPSLVAKNIQNAQDYVSRGKMAADASTSSGGGNVQSGNSRGRSVRFATVLEAHQAHPGPNGSGKVPNSVLKMEAEYGRPVGILKGSRQKRELQHVTPHYLHSPFRGSFSFLRAPTFLNPMHSLHSLLHTNQFTKP